MEYQEKLFVYGTLKQLEIQQEAIDRVAGGTPDVLEGYRKSETLIDGEDYPIITPDSKCSVEGLVLDVSPEELATLDEYEDYYKRIKVLLKSGAAAWVYAPIKM